MAEADYLGIVSGNRVPDKVARTGLHVAKSEFVDAPGLSEFPLTLECKVSKVTKVGEDYLRTLGFKSSNEVATEFFLTYSA